MSIIKANLFQNVSGTTYNMPIAITRYTTTTSWSSSTTSTWNNIPFSFTHTCQRSDSKLIIIGQVHLLSETSGKAQRLRLTRAGIEVYQYSGIQQTSFTGWYAQGAPFMMEFNSNSTSAQTYQFQIYHNTGTAYLNYAYNSSPTSEVVIYEVLQ